MSSALPPSVAARLASVHQLALFAFALLLALFEGPAEIACALAAATSLATAALSGQLRRPRTLLLLGLIALWILAGIPGVATAASRPRSEDLLRPLLALGLLT